MNGKVRVQLSVMMFLQFFVWGAWLLTMWVYLGKLEFTGGQTGWAYATTGIAAIISPFFVGMVADRFFSTERVLAVLHIVGGILLIAITQVTTPTAWFWVLLAYALCYMPTLALVNSLSFDCMKHPDKEFPGIRVWGTIGWIVQGLIIGYILPKMFGTTDAAGVSTEFNVAETVLPFQIAGGVSLLLGVFCFFLPHTPPKSLGHPVTVSDVLGLEALSLFKSRSFTVFVVCSFLVCIPLAFYYQTANGFLKAMDMQNTEWKMTFGQMSEIFFMLLMPFFFVRLGVKWMLVVGMFCWVARYFMFGFASSDNHMLLYLGILVHGICYDFFFVTGQIYVDKKAPLKIRASAQGFIALVTLGLGMVIGNLINGWVIDYYTIEEVVNWRGVWLVPALMSLAVMIAFAILFNDKTADESVAEQS